MGNTNIPQFGALDTDNSRDSLSGTDQLTKEQRHRRSEPAGSTVPKPEDVITRPDKQLRADREGTPGSEEGDKLSAYVGYEDTGHSPSDATSKAHPHKE